MGNNPFVISLDRWPQTEKEFQSLLGCLRFEFDVQAGQRRVEEVGSGRPFQPPRALEIHLQGEREPRTLAHPKQ